MKHPLWDATRPPGTDQGARPCHRYLVLPSPADPRLVVPTRPRRASSTILHALRDRTTVSARARTTAMGAAAALNVRTELLPDPPLFDVIADELGVARDDLVIGVHLGPARANRKPVLAVAGRDGALVAFVKYGVDALTDALVAHEAQSLLALARSRPALEQVGCTVPTLLASGRHEGHEYAIQTPVPVGAAPTTGRRAESPVVVNAQCAVATIDQDEIDPRAALGSVDAAWRARADASRDPTVDRFATVAHTWTELVDRELLVWGSWHGDWRTTNMSVAHDGCSVWDWERFGSGVPVGYDALHLFLTRRLPSTTALTGLPRDVIDNSPRLLRPFGVSDRRAADLTAVGYLLELAGRYLDDDQAAAGARLGAVGEWLLPTLQGWAEVHASTRGGTHS